MAKCYLCPRECGADRSLGELGICGEGDGIRGARYSLHLWEEPPISGTCGSGTIFFSGCSLRCEFCQNRAISHEGKGEPVSVERLAEMILELEAQGAHNINLVTPTHFADKVARALALAKEKLHVPVVYNCGGYESVEALQALSGLVDVYLPDFKYLSPELSFAYSRAKNYAEAASAALCEMYRQVGAVRLDGDGLLQKGVMVRHLVLPGSRQDSVAVLEKIADLIPSSDILLSLMRQYTPDFAPPEAPAPLHRRVTTFEYETVREAAVRLGFSGYCQQASAASTAFTPDFAENERNDG